MKKHRSIPFRVVFILALCLPVAGCVTMGHSSRQSALDQAQRHYESGRYDLAQNEVNALISGSRGSLDDTERARVHRLRADCYRKLKRYTLARYDYETAHRLAASLGRAPGKDDSMAIECEIAIGDMSMHEGSYRIADRIFDRIIGNHPGYGHKDAVLYRRYICALKLERPDPDQFTRQIADMYGFSSAALRKEFLGDTRRIDPVPPQPARASLLRSDARVVVIPRSEWKASPTRLNVNPMTSVNRITVHHTGEEWTVEDYQTSANKMRGFQKYHQENRGWADLGYHFVIDRRGRIWEGRPLRFQGAHAGSSELNRGNVGISVMGNFDNQALAMEQKDSLAALLSVLCNEYGLKPWQICTHKELKSTACPGTHLQRFIDVLKASALP